MTADDSLDEYLCWRLSICKGYLVYTSFLLPSSTKIHGYDNESTTIFRNDVQYNMRRTVVLSFEPGSSHQEVKLKWENPRKRRDVVVTQIDAVWFNSRLVKTFFNTHLGDILLLTWIAGCSVEEKN